MCPPHQTNNTPILVDNGLNSFQEAHTEDILKSESVRNRAPHHNSEPRIKASHRHKQSHPCDTNITDEQIPKVSVCMCVYRHTVHI